MGRQKQKGKNMTPIEARQIREALGFSTEKMAKACGVSGGRTIRRWEAGDRRITPMAKLVYRLISNPIARPVVLRLQGIEAGGEA